MNNIDWNNLFKAGDFDESGDGPFRTPAHEIANNRVREIIEKCPKLIGYALEEHEPWWVQRGEEKSVWNITHQARLICIEEIKK